MPTLKQLQEKGEEEFNNEFGDFVVPALLVYPGANATPREEFSSNEVLDFLHQQTTLAYNAGKAEMLDTVLKEIDSLVIHRCDFRETQLDYISKNFLKNKLLDNK